MKIKISGIINEGEEGSKSNRTSEMQFKKKNSALKTVQQFIPKCVHEPRNANWHHGMLNEKE